LARISSQLAKVQTQTDYIGRKIQCDKALESVQHIRLRIDGMHSAPKKADISSELIDEVTTKFQGLMVDAERLVREDAFLQSLNYEQRRSREIKIQEAHKLTFDWIFDKKDDSMNGNLAIWLASGYGVFWVAGRPGSGKSTLIKFVAEDPRTVSALMQWSPNQPCLMVTHYFWSPGTPVQRSQEGLLRSLLYGILGQAPELIPLVCPKRWQQTGRRSTGTPPSWSVAELGRDLLAIAEMPEIPAKFCLFIDGLDEYKGDHYQLCETIAVLGQSANIKICVSSRPWNDFEEHFSGNPRLSLHDFTRNDIRQYVESQLISHRRWTALERHTSETKQLIDEITIRAHGVFLWVILVVRALRDGLTNEDTLGDLWKRLDNIPNDLEQFFKLILNSVEPFYYEKMAETLLIAVAGNEPLHMAVYSFHDLSYEDKNYVFNQKVEPWEEDKFTAFTQPFSRRLNSRCKGMLEPNVLDRVEFLHRTVSDFLRTPEMVEYLARKARPRFDPKLAIFQAYICWFKHARFQVSPIQAIASFRKNDLVVALEDALSYAQDADEYENPFDSFTHDLIQDFEWSVHTMFHTGQISYPGTETKDHARNLFKRCVLRGGLTHYRPEKLVRVPGYVDDLEVPPLALALRVDDVRQSTDSKEWTPSRLRLLQSLLDTGHDPNQEYTNPFTGNLTTPWAEYIRQMIPYPSLEEAALPVTYPKSPFMEALQCGVFSMLITAGASTDTLVDDERGSPEPLQAWVLFFLACFSIREVADHADHYVQALGQLLKSANLQGMTAYFQSLGEWITGASPAVLSRSLGVPRSHRMAAWNIVCCFLRSLSAQNNMGLTFHKLQFYARVIGTLLKAAIDKTLTMDVIKPVLCRHLSDSLVTLVIETAEPVSCCVAVGAKSNGEDVASRKRMALESSHLLGPVDSDRVAKRRR